MNSRPSKGNASRNPPKGMQAEHGPVVALIRLVARSVHRAYFAFHRLCHKSGELGRGSRNVALKLCPYLGGLGLSDALRTERVRGTPICDDIAADLRFRIETHGNAGLPVRQDASDIRPRL